MTRGLAAFAAAAAAALISACTSTPSAHPRGPATERPATRAIAQPLGVYTHCGIRWATFTGHNWVATPVLSDGSGNPPPGWGNPYQHGTVTVGDSTATFVSDTGLRATFRIATPADTPPPPCD
jgi:hypothetical protein